VSRPTFNPDGSPAARTEIKSSVAEKDAAVAAAVQAGVTISTLTRRLWKKHLDAVVEDEVEVLDSTGSKS
jgi:hypothetical protein